MRRCHDGHRGHGELPTRAALDEGDIVRADDMHDQRLGDQRLDEPAGLKKRGARGSDAALEQADVI